jgi:hypothetical protein
VLGLALLAVRTGPNRFWMLLLGNAEVAFPSTAATTSTAAVNLHTPAAAAAVAVATSNNAAAAATDTATRATSTTGAADNVATPTDCQKRKARP